MIVSNPKQLLHKALLLFVVSGFAPVHAVSMAPTSFNVSNNSYSDDDFSINSTALYLQQTLVEDSLALKGKLESRSVDDESTEQVVSAGKYSETQTSTSLGMEYIYYDSSISFSGSYATEESTTISDIALDFAQEYNNGSSHLLMGFSHGWESDSDLALHNKSREINLGNEFNFSPRWKLFTGFDFINHDGDLVNFHSARRFNNPTRTQLPEGRTDQRFRIKSTHDIGKDRILTLEIQQFRNDWRQSGQSLRLVLMRHYSEKFNLTTHIESTDREKSRYYVTDVAGTTESYYSDHRHHAKQKSQTFGLTGQWHFWKSADRRVNNLSLDFGYSYLKTEYQTTNNISNSGNLIHLNLAGTY